MNHFFSRLLLVIVFIKTIGSKLWQQDKIFSSYPCGQVSALTMRESLCVYWFCCCCYFLFGGICLWMHRLCIPPVFTCSWHCEETNKPDCSERNLDSLREQSAHSPAPTLLTKTHIHILYILTISTWKKFASNQFMTENKIF